MEEGAFGLSSGLDYPPGSFASTDELASLTAEAGKLGGFYHTHVRYTLGDRFLDPFREAIEIGKRGGSPAHITHFYHRSGYPGGPEQLLGLVEDARAQGQDVTFDEKKKASADEVSAACVGNLCRCTGYEPIVRAGTEVNPSQIRPLSELFPPEPMLRIPTCCSSWPPTSRAASTKASSSCSARAMPRP